MQKLRRWLVLTLVAGVLLTVLPVLAMRWIDPVSSAFMVQAKLNALVEGKTRYRTQYRWVDFNRISPEAGMAVIAAEDQWFSSHYGFDFNSIRKAVIEGQDGKVMRGASTISQQVAKNLFLWSGRSFFRKGLEAWFTVLIEAMWPKQRILEVYLNIAEFGPGVYGVQAAARHFYNKPASRLNRPEAALLAAVLPNPRLFKVNRPSRYVMSRQQWILRQIRGLGGRVYLQNLDAATAPYKLLD